MGEDERKNLVEQSGGCTLEGVPCSVAGYLNGFATISPRCGGFWRAKWEDVKRVIENGKEFTSDDVWFSSWVWLGDGTDMPERLRKLVPNR